MSQTQSKLLQRAKLLKILNKYRQDFKISEKEFQQDIEEIANIENQVLVCKTLFQEISTPKSSYSNICAIFAIRAIKSEIFEKEALEYLKNENADDSKKIFIMSLIKEKGIKFGFDEISNYVDSSEELAHGGVVDFLSSALLEAEVQIDLLDFFVNLPDDERLDFLERLTQDFEGDNLANAFSILVQTKLDEIEFGIIQNSLLDINSYYSIVGLKYIVENCKVKQSVQTKIRKKILELSTKCNKPSEYPFSNSIVFKIYISFVDGNSNFSLIFSRIKPNGLVHALLLCVNIKQGITSCMGFEAITLENFTSIIKRLFEDSAPVEIEASEFRTIFDCYLSKTIKNNNELPYELIVWKKMLSDVKSNIEDISEYINLALKTTKLDDKKMRKFVKSKLVETWYYTQGDNEYFDELLQNIENKHLVDLDAIDEFSNNLIEEKILKDEDFILELKKRLVIQSYVAKNAKLMTSSDFLYSLCFDEKYFKLLLSSMIDKGLYYYFEDILSDNTDNLFLKKQTTKFSKEEIGLILSQLEEKWI